MLEVAAKRNIALLTYGSIGGGLLSDRWLGREQPTSRADLDTASLGMYYRSLQRTFRGWEDFQDLLKALRGAVFFKNTCCFRLAPCFPDNLSRQARDKQYVEGELILDGCGFRLL